MPRDSLMIPAGLLAAVVALLCGACTASGTPDSFASGDPAGRMRAAAAAGEARDATAVPHLVNMLASDDPAERMVAIGTLEQLTGQRLGYDPTALGSQREAAIARWRSWVARESGRGNDPATVTGGKSDR